MAQERVDYPQQTTVEAARVMLKDHSVKSVGKVGATIVLLDAIGIGDRSTHANTSVLSYDIDGLFQISHHIPPDPSLIPAFQRNAIDVAQSAENALARLRRDEWIGFGDAQRTQHSILELLDRIPHSATQLVIAKDVVSPDEGIANMARHLLTYHEDKLIYPETLVYFLSYPGEDISEFGWSIINSNDNAGFDHQAKQVPEEIRQKLGEMLASPKPTDRHRAAILVSKLYQRTEGSIGEDLQKLAIESLVRTLDKRSVWMQENFDIFASSGDKKTLGKLVRPYRPETRRSLERLVESFVEGEEPEYVRLGRGALKRHADQWWHYGQHFQKDPRDLFAEIPTANQDIED